MLSPVPGHKPIPRCDRAQVSCWYSISKRMVIIPGERCAPTKPSRLSNAFAHAPVYIPVFIRANTISAQVLNSARVTPAQRKTLTNCWLWVANYSKEPRATAPWNYWALWQYCGDGKCRLPRSAYPISIANIRKAELNIFRGSRNDLADFWQRRAWNPSGGAPRRESERTDGRAVINAWSSRETAARHFSIPRCVVR